MSQSYSKSGMTSSGRVAPNGTFGYLKVRRYQQARGVDGGEGATVRICHGRVPGGPEIANVAAAIGAEIDMLAAPVACPNGIYLQVEGDPARIDVEVHWK